MTDFKDKQIEVLKRFVQLSIDLRDKQKIDGNEFTTVRIDGIGYTGPVADSFGNHIKHMAVAAEETLRAYRNLEADKDHFESYGEER